MRQHESKLQQACVKWFRLAYPQHKKLLASFPNGGHRNITTAVRMKAEGQLAGASDLFLFKPKMGNEVIYHGLCIEVKYGNGRQSKEQKDFQCAVEQQGYVYKICRSLDEFRLEVDLWFGV